MDLSNAPTLPSGERLDPSAWEAAHRVVTNPHWRKAPGMRYVDLRTGEAVRIVGGNEWPSSEWPNNHPRAEWVPGGHSVPDLTDAPTLRCLTELVREAWGSHMLVVLRIDEVTPKWRCTI